MKITNETLAQYIEIESEIKRLSDQLEILRAMLKDTGSMSTRDYVVIVEDRERSVGPGLEVLRKLFGEKKINPLVKTISYQILKVHKKAA